MLLRNSKGFTLVEMLIALTLLGITLSIAYGSLAVANKTTKLVRDSHQETESLRTSFFFLSKYFSRLDTGEIDSKTLSGTQHELFFTANVALNLTGGSALYHFRLHQNYTPNAKTQLILTYEPANGSSQGLKVEQVLAEYRGKLLFSYNISPTKSDGSLLWLDSWSDLKLPARIKIFMQSDNINKWPTQVFRLTHVSS
jgi:general secretion pathway protein J